MSGTILVRPATVDDAAAIARVHVQSWREAYAGRMPADFLASLDEARFARNWENILADGVTDAFVAERDGEVVGWATAGPGRDDDAPRPRELEGIYLLAAAHGSGAGQLWSAYGWTGVAGLVMGLLAVDLLVIATPRKPK